MDKQDDELFYEEKEHLNLVQEIITTQLNTVEEQLSKSADSILQHKKYLWENIYELDPEEIASNRLQISESHDSHDQMLERKRLLQKLQDNSYFARIDFAYEEDDDAQALYIGLGGLVDKKSYQNYIFDWRAPIASMYYDFSVGPAYYTAPIGKIEGTITQKRQMKVRKGQLEYVFASDDNVNDEILQRELAGSGSTKMRNIVSTIQKEQNKIVRDLQSEIMIVQGVAGSGKTSIALHRIAYMLYQYKNTISSSQVLILSPNSIFSEYISNVLPELGEQNISEVNFDVMAEHELKKICTFEPKYEQAEYIVSCTKETDERLMAIRYKAGKIFLDELKTYASGLSEKILKFKDISVLGYNISSTTLKEWYNRYSISKPLFERLEGIADRIVDMYSTDHNVDISKKIQNEVKDYIFRLVDKQDILEIYTDFLKDMGEKYNELSFVQVDKKHILYEDVFPLVLFKMLVYGKEASQYSLIKHVLVDEMQDYSMIQFEILKECFKCNMTILGDINQVMDKDTGIVIEELPNIFEKKVTLIQLMKSYRSTFEISEFCRKIGRIQGMESIERHGAIPQIIVSDSYSEMIDKIKHSVEKIDLNTVTTVAIICKTQKQAKKLYDSFDGEFSKRCYLMNEPDSHFQEGIIITNSYLVKGLEFDHVIISDASEENYHSERDRQMLYIGCTRALHGLELFAINKLSNIVPV